MKNSKATPPTAQELNAIQADWMKIDPTESTPAERQAIYKRLEVYPKAYLSLNSDKTQANAIIDGGPAWAFSRPTTAALDYLKRLDHHNARLDVAWQGSTGQWVTIQP